MSECVNLVSLYKLVMCWFFLLGDPTVFGNLNVADECVAAVSKALHSGKHNGYPSSIGKD